MPSKSMPVREAREIAQRIAAEMNVELVDAELVKEPTGHFLRFYILDSREDKMRNKFSFSLFIRF